MKWTARLRVYGLVAILGASPASAQSGDLQARVQAILESYQNDYGFPGATAAYVLSDGRSGTAAVGLADVENARR